MTRVLRLHFCYVIPLGQDKTYSTNPIFKLNTTIMVRSIFFNFKIKLN